MKTNTNNELGCFIRIKKKLNTFSNSEKKVAEYILNNPKKVILATVSAVAQASSTSVTTVTRFCQNIGYSGFQEFKIVLSQNIAEPLSSVHEDVKIEDDIDTIKMKITQANINALESTVHMLNSQEIHKAVNALVKADTIAFFGMGGSGPVALDAQHKFLRTGKRCIAYVDKHMQLVNASMFTDSYVMVGITHSGYNKDMVDVFKVSKEHHATTIVITHDVTSPITKIADICLFSSSKETFYRKESLSSRIAILTIIDILFVGTGLRINEQMLRNQKKINSAITLTRM